MLTMISWMLELDVTNSVWNSHRNGPIKYLEKVQMNATVFGYEYDRKDLNN